MQWGLVPGVAYRNRPQISQHAILLRRKPEGVTPFFLKSIPLFLEVPLQSFRFPSPSFLALSRILGLTDKLNSPYDTRVQNGYPPFGSGSLLLHNRGREHLFEGLVSSHVDNIKESSNNEGKKGKKISLYYRLKCNKLRGVLGSLMETAPTQQPILEFRPYSVPNLGP